MVVCRSAKIAYIDPLVCTVATVGLCVSVWTSLASCTKTFEILMHVLLHIIN